MLTSFLHEALLCSQAHLSQTKSPFPSSITRVSSGSISLPHISHFIDWVFVISFLLASLCYKHHFCYCLSPSLYSASCFRLPQTRQPARHSRRYLRHWNLKYHYYSCYYSQLDLRRLIACCIIRDFALQIFILQCLQFSHLALTLCKTISAGKWVLIWPVSSLQIKISAITTW